LPWPSPARSRELSTFFAGHSTKVFEDRHKLYADQTLASVRATPEFAQLMSEQQLH
jgi:hypothetical protein